VICKLPADKYRKYGEGRWFFFTDRERKHVGGNRPNRTTPDNGHWNATGSIRPIRSAGGVLVGCRRTLVFYEASRSRKKKKNQAAGLPPTEEQEEDGDGGQAAKAKDGVKTEWTMYEYESLDSEAEFEALRSGNASKVSSSLSASPFHLDVVSACVSARDIITNIGLILFLYTDGRSGLVHDPEEEALPGGW